MNTVFSQWRALARLPSQLDKQFDEQFDKQLELIERQNRQLSEMQAVLAAQTAELQHVHARVAKLEDALHTPFTSAQLSSLSPRMRRNTLPNDDSAVHKSLQLAWQAEAQKPIGQRELLASGFRVFSQNDEDGTLLRLFSHIGTTNQCVVEIGSNCSGSDLGFPENLSTNLIVNHGWHGAIMEIDGAECDRTRHFFATDYATKHFHAGEAGRGGYFSPLVIQGEITPANIDQMLRDAHTEPEPDLFVIDIDGGDYAVVERMTAVRPRVMVVEFEKRFRDRHAVVQFDRNDFSRRWAQSGAASLPAWEKLMTPRGYRLCGIATCGFNAFFVREEIAEGRLERISAARAFDLHPILSKVDEKVWLTPDESWKTV